MKLYERIVPQTHIIARRIFSFLNLPHISDTAAREYPVKRHNTGGIIYGENPFIYL